jgi:hypothetical protein
MDYFSRRDAIKAASRATAYAAPVVTSSGPLPAAAQLVSPSPAVRITVVDAVSNPRCTQANAYYGVQVVTVGAGSAIAGLTPHTYYTAYQTLDTAGGQQTRIFNIFAFSSMFDLSSYTFESAAPATPLPRRGTLTLMWGGVSPVDTPYNAATAAAVASFPIVPSAACVFF